MTLQELTTFDRVFQNYLLEHDHDDDARDLYITTMEAHTNSSRSLELRLDDPKTTLYEVMSYDIVSLTLCHDATL